MFLMPCLLAASDDNEKLLATGKKIFAQRCAKCHNERGDKPLRTGPPLDERKLTHEEIARNAGGRLRDVSEEERRSVVLYIQSFMKR